MAQVIISDIYAELKSSIPSCPRATFVVGTQRHGTRGLQSTISPRWAEELVFNGLNLYGDHLDIAVEDAHPRGSEVLGTTHLELSKLNTGRNRQTLTLSQRSKPIGVIAFNVVVAPGAGHWPGDGPQLQPSIETLDGGGAAWPLGSMAMAADASAVRIRLREAEAGLRSTQSELEGQTQQLRRLLLENERLLGDNARLQQENGALSAENHTLQQIVEEKKMTAKLLKEKSDGEIARLQQEVAELLKAQVTLQQALDEEMEVHGKAETLAAKFLEQQEELKELRRQLAARMAEKDAQYVGPHDEQVCRALERALADMGVGDDLSQWTMRQLLDGIRAEAIKLRNQSVGVNSAENYDLRRHIEAMLWKEFQLQSEPSGYSPGEMVELMAIKVRSLHHLLEEHQWFAVRVSEVAGCPIEEGFFTSAVMNASKLRARLDPIVKALASLSNPSPPDDPPRSQGGLARSPRQVTISPQPETIASASASPILPSSARVMVAPETFRVYYSAPERALQPRYYIPPEVHEVHVTRKTPVAIQNHARSAPDLQIRKSDDLGRELVATLSDLHRAEVKAQRLNRRLGPTERHIHAQTSSLSHDMAEARDRLEGAIAEAAIRPRTPLSQAGSRSGTPTSAPSEARLLVSNTPVVEYGDHIFFRRGREVSTAGTSGNRSNSRGHRSRSRSPSRPVWH
eukprot:GGOE01014447.1.p1 GENE.GGOE01014447.1~~GGOE01014447.1.p1  ORF type:complete len:684 (+),score=100.13 GGOE01014447.1:57-2108(+)